jgi:hypothetical protein
MSMGHERQEVALALGVKERALVALKRLSFPDYYYSHSFRRKKDTFNYAFDAPEVNWIALVRLEADRK